MPGSTRTFRVLRGQSRAPRAERDSWPESLPWDMVEPWREQAERNHGQTLERLNDRGGLAPEELWCAAHGGGLRTIRHITESAAGAWLTQLVAARSAAVKTRCTGHCCRGFPLPVSLDELRRRQAGEPGAGRPVHDGDYIAAMLIPVGETTYQDGTTGYLFNCRHHDSESGDCKAYDSRPRMCRDYPYGRACTKVGCTSPDRSTEAEPLLMIGLRPQAGS